MVGELTKRLNFPSRYIITQLRTLYEYTSFNTNDRENTLIYLETKHWVNKTSENKIINFIQLQAFIKCLHRVEGIRTGKRGYIRHEFCMELNFWSSKGEIRYLEVFSHTHIPPIHTQNTHFLTKRVLSGVNRGPDSK